MEKKKDIISLLYKAAKKHDADILKHFNDEDLSDHNYFLYAINEDIMSNIINVILNLAINNTESPGVDNSCRMIIEAITLLSMYNEKQVSDLQLKIFRYSYALVEIDNFRSFLKNPDSKIPLDIEKDKETALNLFAEQFGMSRETLDNLLKEKNPSKKIYLSDPLAFLMKTPKNKIKIEKLIRQYHPYKDLMAKLYAFFSIFDHPRYEEDIELELKFQKIKKQYVFIVIKTVKEYFQLNKLFLANEEEYTDEIQDLFESEYKENNKSALNAIEKIFNTLMDELATYDDGMDLHAIFYLNKLRCIAENMFVCMHRGYREQVIAAFRPFAELSSIINKINTYDVDEYRILRTTFVLNSRLQLIDFVDSVADGKIMFDGMDLKYLYENYYKEKYGLDNYLQFEQEMIRNSLYFLDNTKRNYKSIVLDNSFVIFNEKTLQDEFITIYKIAIDMSHSSGYVFNSCQGITDSYALRSQILFWSYIYQYAGLMAITRSEHGYSSKIDKPMAAIKLIIDGLTKDLDKLYK